MPSLFYKPSDVSSILVDHYLSIKSNVKDNITSGKFIPDGYSAFVFNFGRPVRCINTESEILLPPFFITKPFLGHLTIETPPSVDSFIISVKTSVFSRLFNISLESVQSKTHFLKDIFKGYTIREDLAAANTFEERIEIFSDYLFRNILPPDYEYDLIDKIYFKIMEEGGTVPLKTILSGFDINPRSGRRNFIKRVGISAKGLSRIIRVNYFLKKIQDMEKKDFNNFILECNYYDQSHFIKDFKGITGETPQSFIKRDLTAEKIVSGWE